MMKRILAASAALVSVAAMASTASAAPLSQTITVTGDVAAVCSVTNTLPPTATIPGLAAADDTLNTGAISGQFFSFGEVWCNGHGSKLTVSVSPLSNPVTTSDTTHFTSRVDYKLAATLDGAAIGSLDTSTGGSISNAPVGIFDGTVVVTGSIDPNPGKKLVAGTYTSTLTATLTPGL